VAVAVFVFVAVGGTVSVGVFVQNGGCVGAGITCDRVLLASLLSVTVNLESITALTVVNAGAYPEKKTDPEAPAASPLTDTVLPSTSIVNCPAAALPALRKLTSTPSGFTCPGSIHTGIGYMVTDIPVIVRSGPPGTGVIVEVYVLDGVGTLVFVYVDVFVNVFVGVSVDVFVAGTTVDVFVAGTTVDVLVAGIIVDVLVAGIIVDVLVAGTKVDVLVFTAVFV
jgi:hypothetical protein